MSSTATSGRCSVAACSASRPVAATATTRRSGSASKTARSPDAKTGWSSARISVIMATSRVEAAAGPTPPCPTLERANRQRAAHLGRPLLHGPQSHAGRTVAVETAPVVADGHVERLRVDHDRNQAGPSSTVPNRVGHGLDRDPVGGRLHRGRQPVAIGSGPVTSIAHLPGQRGGPWPVPLRSDRARPAPAGAAPPPAAGCPRAQPSPRCRSRRAGRGPPIRRHLARGQARLEPDRRQRRPQPVVQIAPQAGAARPPAAPPPRRGTGADPGAAGRPGRPDRPRRPASAAARGRPAPAGRRGRVRRPAADPPPRRGG